ncbi:MAG: ribosome biogenesis/translation initiation ATPase RLI [Hadesarchaea archaeon]|nr:MAG: ribosome biogenesis/translation initiation ATPase RLI [Hadesarchaea archaeon]HDI12777.1 ribosome biogenesis/translation initiation ATPase RLI [Hadesarchaea archaeon]
MPRIAVINRNSCQPKRCSLECYHYCPGVRTGEETIVIEESTNRPVISEELCTGCGICTHKCPFHAISIINLPSELEGRCIHRYGSNGFALYELPVPRAGSVVGLVGPNGVGKSTALEILSGRLRPNLGSGEAATPKQLNEFFKGSELQSYFSDIERVKVIYKPQSVNGLPKIVKGKVNDLLLNVDERGAVEDLVSALGLGDILTRDVKFLSGGELQRLAIAAASARDADVYYFDEPSSHLDVFQRLNAARAIRKLAKDGKAVVVVEHDLAMLDYMCDYVHVVYGQPGAYGVVSSPRGVRTGINVFLDGYLREENVRFRRESIKFEVRPPSKFRAAGKLLLTYPKLKKSFRDFRLEVTPGTLHVGEIVGVVGPNAIGKTTFVRMLAGELKPTSGKLETKLIISYKPQYPKTEFDGTVEEWLRSVLGEFDPAFEPEVLQPLGVMPLFERNLTELSGGELQRVAIAACIGRSADLYLLDEPSAYLDVEQRLQMARVIRKVIEKRDAAALVVDHDVLSVDFISDRLLVFTGEPSRSGTTHGPMEMRDGMNLFLREVGVTFRRDPQTGRPRANKPGSALDREQQERGEYFYL